ncbi:MAG: glucose 1-dehydrogenase [Sedimentibacter sp.]|jgi:NAD(P)-dependent dehydrogenase (short-subunit alcohol dehydrogenase family)|uniref:SDR family NAD(P)-dependent oxidoreductase n=1 Tax=Sedimentibacter sp. TaxID=1960295 RepID=UPI003158766B
MSEDQVKMPNFDLTGKVAIVTGSSTGLGRGMALALAHFGASVVVSSRHLDKCEEVVKEIEDMGKKAIAVKCDVKVRAEVENLVKQAVEKFGRLDIIVNNAGMGITKKVIEMTEEEWDEVYDTNVKGTFFGGAAAAKQMIEQGQGGRIINIASAGGLVGTKNIAAYCSSKAAVVSLSKTEAMELGKYGITCNTICPGYVPTGINSKPLSIPKVYDQIVGRTALKRLGEIGEIAGVVVFLASDASSIVTGAYIAADMGTTCN